MSIIAQKSGVSFSTGFGLMGEESMNGYGIHFSSFFPIGNASEIKSDINFNSLPPHTDEEGFDKLKINSLEIDYRYVFNPEGERGFMQFGIGLNLNVVNGGINYNEKIELPGGGYTFKSYENIWGIGIGLNIGLGLFIIPKAAIYGEYTAQGIFGEAETGWGGLKFGVRYFPWRKKEKIERPWLNQ